MREITLTQDKVALIDDADFELVSRYKWHALKLGGVFYATANNTNERGKRRKLYMQRLLLNPAKGMKVKHRDGNTLNNQRANLYLSHCTTDQSPTGYFGVKKVKSSKNPWSAYYSSNKVRHHIGCFPTAEEAARARDEKAKEIWGENANLNFPATTGGLN